MRFDALYAALGEYGGGVCENPRREQHVERDDGHHDVELELAVLGGDGYGGIEPDHLEADLIDHLRNRRIDLSGHDRRSRLDGGQLDLVDPGAWAHDHEAQI